MSRQGELVHPASTYQPDETCPVVLENKQICKSCRKIIKKRALELAQQPVSSINCRRITIKASG